MIYIVHINNVVLAFLEMIFNNVTMVVHITVHYGQVNQLVVSLWLCIECVGCGDEFGSGGIEHPTN